MSCNSLVILFCASFTNTNPFSLVVIFALRCVASTALDVYLVCIDAYFWLT